MTSMSTRAAQIGHGGSKQKKKKRKERKWGWVWEVEDGYGEVRETEGVNIITIYFMDF